MNIVLLVVDTLRSKDLCNDDSIAPFLMNQGEEGFYLKNYYSTSPWTAPAHASMFTSDLPSEHGLTTDNTVFQGSNKLLDAVEDFHTLGLSENSLVSEVTNLSIGFDDFIYFGEENRGGKVWQETWRNDSEFNSRFSKWVFFTKNCLGQFDFKSAKYFFKYLLSEKIRSQGPKFNSRNISEIFDHMIEEINREQDSFIFANILPVHYPYTFGNEEKEIFLEEIEDSRVEECIRGLDHEEYLGGNVELDSKFLDIRERGYRASIRYTDKKIKELYKSATEDTVFIVIGDHGELFGEYEKMETPIIGHHFGTFKELIEVPCFIFSKSDLDLELNEEALYDHRDIRSIVCGLRYGEMNRADRKLVKAEYFGLKGFYQQFREGYPDELEEIFSRKSFSVVNKSYKFDMTSEGTFLWDFESYTEIEELNRNVPEEIQSKADIFYSDYLNSD